MTQSFVVDITLEFELHDLFVGFLVKEEIDFDGVEQNADGLGLFIQAEENELAHKQKQIELILAQISKKSNVEQIRMLPNKNWNMEWEKSIKAIDVPPFFIKPDIWDGVVPNGREVIRINPKMAFGTGYHETTRLMLRLIDSYVKKGHYVIDAGTGSGILAIAAANKGALEVFGFDIDPWSKKNAEENVLLNKVVEKVTIKEGDQLLLKDCKIADIVLANINREVLIQLIPYLSEKLTVGGILILSGLLNTDLQKILAQRILIDDFKLLTQIEEGEWLAFAFRKTSE